MLVTGCQSEDAPPPPSPSPTVSATSAPPTPSPTPSPTDGEIPPAARVQSEEGAKAFAKFYIELTGRAWMTPDPRLLDGHSTANCSTCSNLQSVAESLGRESQRFVAAPIAVKRLQKFSGSPERWVFDAELTQTAVDVVDKAGATVRKQEQRSLSRAIAVVWEEERWLVDGISE